MTPDPLRERVARVLAAVDGWEWDNLGDWSQDRHRDIAAAVLADLREAGELREYERLTHGQAVQALNDGVPVYIVREDTEPCPRGCTPEGEKK